MKEEHKFVELVFTCNEAFELFLEFCNHFCLYTPNIHLERWNDNKYWWVVHAFQLDDLGDRIIKMIRLSRYKDYFKIIDRNEEE